jgi:hypothetical protein
LLRFECLSSGDFRQIFHAITGYYSCIVSIAVVGFYDAVQKQPGFGSRLLLSDIISGGLVVFNE